MPCSLYRRSETKTFAPTRPKRCPFERRRTSSMSSNFRDGSKPLLSRNSLLLSAIQCPAPEGSVLSEAFRTVFQKAWIALIAGVES
jgi:hypothetical protein